MENIEVELLNAEVIEKYGSHLKYILLTCKTCNRTWGVNVIDNKLRPDQMVCQRCSVNKIAYGSK